MTSPSPRARRDPWWPIEYGDECGSSSIPHKRIMLPSGIEVFAAMSREEDAIYVALMREPGQSIHQHYELVRCADFLEQRALLLELAYPEG